MTLLNESKVVLTAKFFNIKVALADGVAETEENFAILGITGINYRFFNSPRNCLALIAQLNQRIHGQRIKTRHG